MQSIVVTGVSSGIGRACAEAFVGAGYRVFGSVRKQADADRLRQELGERFAPIFFDVTDESAIVAAAAQVREAIGGEKLAGLVNNAGVAVPNPALVQTTEDFRRQMEVNLIGPFAVTRAFAPLLGADKSLTGKPGRIVNISSVGGKLGAPFLGAYSASKHGIEGWSESLRRELKLYGIDVIIVGPGAVATPIWDKAEADFDQLEALKGGDWEGPATKMADFFIADGRKGLPPSAIAAVVRDAIEHPSPKTRYAVLRGKFANWTLPMLLPKRWVDNILAARLGLKPGAG